MAGMISSDAWPRGTVPRVPHGRVSKMSLQGPKTAEWFDRANKALVNGVSSGFRYWGDEDTLVIDRGEGAYAFDMDGKRYNDYQLGFGPIILGHGHQPVRFQLRCGSGNGRRCTGGSPCHVIRRQDR